MSQKDFAFVALGVALCAQGFLVANVVLGLWGNAVFCTVMLVLSCLVVMRFINVAHIPNARSRRVEG